MKKLIVYLLLAVTAVAAFFLIRTVTRENALPESFCESETSDPYELSQGEVAVSIAFNNIAGIFSGELQSNDIVAILLRNEETDEYEWNEDLTGLRVLTILIGPAKQGNEETIVQTVTLKATQLQAEILATLSSSGDYHIVLMKRGEK